VEGVPDERSGVGEVAGWISIEEREYKDSDGIYQT
jgi:hypothetical protein